MGIIEFEAEGDADLIEREREKFFSLLPQAITAVSPVVNQKVEYVQTIDNQDMVEEEIKPKANLMNKEDRHYESIASYLNSMNFSTDVEVIMGIAYYLEIFEEKEWFTSKDLQEKLTEARRSKLSNPSSFISANIKKGYLQELPEKMEGKKAYRLLNNGIKWCENYKPNNTDTIKKTNGTKTNGSKAKKKNSSPLLDINMDELNLSSYCDITKIDNIEDQVLVMMYIYTKERGIDCFSYDDIVSVFKVKLKIQINERKVRYIFDKGGLMFDKNKKDGRVCHKLMSSGVQKAERIIVEYKQNEGNS